MEKIRHETIESSKIILHYTSTQCLKQTKTVVCLIFVFKIGVEELIELGEVEGLFEAVHDEKGSAVHGYYYSDHDGKLDLLLQTTKELLKNTPYIKMTQRLH